MSTELTLNYAGTVLNPVTIDGQMWLRVNQIDVPLGFSSPIAATTLWRRHRDEFTTEEARIVVFPTEGGPQEVLVFSLRGARLLALLARTEPARKFRRWILDLLEGRVRVPDAAARLRELETRIISLEARRMLESVAAWPEVDPVVQEKIRAALETGAGLMQDDRLEALARRFLAFTAAQRTHMKEFGAIRSLATREGYPMEAVKAEARRLRASAPGQGALALPRG